MDFSGDERDVRELERAYDEARTSGDLARLMSFFGSGAVIVTPYGDVWEGLPAIEQGLRAVMSQPARGRHTSTIDAVHFVTGDVALVDGHAVLDTSAALSTEEHLPLLHSFSDVVVKHEGVWRIAHVRAYGVTS